jgi:hypothetical protein
MTRGHRTLMTTTQQADVINDVRQFLNMAEVAAAKGDIGKKRSRHWLKRGCRWRNWSEWSNERAIHHDQSFGMGQVCSIAPTGLRVSTCSACGTSWACAPPWVLPFMREQPRSTKSRIDGRGVTDR